MPGAIDLKDLIIARESDSLERAHQPLLPLRLARTRRSPDCVDRIADYAEDSLPVLTADGTLAGVARRRSGPGGAGRRRHG